MPDNAPPRTMLCLSCRYSLNALPDSTCPECGRGFDPADPATFLQPRVFMVPAQLSRPPELVYFILGSAGSLLLIAAYGSLRREWWFAWFGGILWLALICIFTPRILARLFVPSQRYRLHVPARTFWRRLAALGLLLGATLLAIKADLPFRLRFMAQIPVFTSIANKAERSPFTITDIEGDYLLVPHAIAAFKLNGGLAIEVCPRDDTGFEPTPWHGIARIRGTPPPWPSWRDGEAKMEFSHLWGEWYLWRWAGPTWPW